MVISCRMVGIILQILFSEVSMNKFSITTEGFVDITSYGFPKREDGSLYYYENQSWLGDHNNQIDFQFLQLCNMLFVYFSGQEDVFKRLTCTKEQPVGDRYIVRLQTGNEDLRMELSEMVVLFEQRIKGK